MRWQRLLMVPLIFTPVSLIRRSYLFLQVLYLLQHLGRYLYSLSPVYLPNYDIHLVQQWQIQRVEELRMTS